MKRRWKQIGSLFLAVCMVFTMLPAVAFAADGSTVVTTAEALKAALEGTGTAPIEVTENFSVTGPIYLGADHELRVPSGKTLSFTDTGKIHFGAQGTPVDHTLTINGGGTLDFGVGTYRIGSYNPVRANPTSYGTVNLSNINVKIFGNGFCVRNLNIGDGAIITSEGERIGTAITIDSGRTCTISNGATVDVKNHATPGIGLWGTLIISGGAVTLGKGNPLDENHSPDPSIEAASGSTLKITAGTLNGTTGGYIYLYEGAKVQSTANKFSDWSHPFTALGEVIIGAYSGTPSGEGLTEGAYLWDGTVFAQHGITVTSEPQNTSVTAGSITGSLSVTATASNSKAVSYEWMTTTDRNGNYWIDGTPIPGATSAAFTIPTDLTVGTYYYFCYLRADGCWDLVSDIATVTVAAPGGAAPIEITGFKPLMNVNAGRAGSADFSNAAEVRNHLQMAHPFADAMHSGTQETPFLITGWEDTDGYNSNMAGSYTFTATFAMLPGFANSAAHKVSIEVVVAPVNSGGGGGGSATPAAPITSISVEDLSAGNKPVVTVKSVAGTLTLPSHMLSNLDVAKDAKAEVKMVTVNPNNLAAETQALIGGRPIVAINLVINGRVTGWNNPDAPVTVSIPYVPTVEELQNPGGITAFYIDSKGNLIEMAGAKYDPVTKSVVFQTTHFSYYAVGYKTEAIKMQFGDVKPGAWYYDAVRFCVEKGITSGTSETTFSPKGTLSRGQFITMLLKAYDIDPVSNATDNFIDAGNTYYTGYLAAAKATGIASGLGGNRFAPEQAITRQEMFTMLYNALKSLNKLPAADNGKALADFTDSGYVASWATDPMSELVRSGIVSGSGSKLNPRGGSTRAQMAQVLYNLLEK